jgi:hypothetical protein
MTVRDPEPDDARLPLRWAFIIAVAGAVGYVVGHARGVEAGFTVAVALAGFLYLALGKR